MDNKDCRDCMFCGEHTMYVDHYLDEEFEQEPPPQDEPRPAVYMCDSCWCVFVGVMDEAAP